MLDLKMWFPALFIGVSVGLFVWWFRYTCALILCARSAKDYSASVARVNALRFPEIERRLADHTRAERAYLDLLRRALVRDYMLLTCLMRNGAEFRNAGLQMEHRMLMLDFQIMRAWYRVARRLSIQKGRETLAEMVDILHHFADTMGECSAAH